MMAFLNTVFYGNMVRVWLAAFLLVVVVIIVLHLIKRMIVRHIASLADKTGTPVDNMLVNMLAKTHPLFVLLLAIYLATWVLALPDQVTRVIDTAVIIALIVQGGLWSHELISFWLRRYHHNQIEDSGSTTAFVTLGLIGKLVTIKRHC